MKDNDFQMKDNDCTNDPRTSLVPVCQFLNWPRFLPELLLACVAWDFAFAFGTWQHSEMKFSGLRRP